MTKDMGTSLMLKPRLNNLEAWIIRLKQSLYKVGWYVLFVEGKEGLQFLCKGDVFLTEIRGNGSPSDQEEGRVLLPIVHLSVKFTHI